MISYDDFSKISLKTAKIIEVEDHPNADRLYVLKIDAGEGIRQVVAGIKNSYEKENLVGKTVVFIENLEPATIRGVESQGMILAAKDDLTLAIISPERAISPGSTVK